MVILIGEMMTDRDQIISMAREYFVLTGNKYPPYDRTKATWQDWYKGLAEGLKAAKEGKSNERDTDDSI